MERFVGTKGKTLPAKEKLVGWGLTVVIDAIDHYILCNDLKAAKVLAAQKGYVVRTI